LISEPEFFNSSHLEIFAPEGELAPPNAAPNSVFTPFIDCCGLEARGDRLDLRLLELRYFRLWFMTIGACLAVRTWMLR
jgi:hypothetical protein